MFKTIIGIVVVTLVILIAMAAVDRVTGAITDTGGGQSSAKEEDDSLQVTITGEVMRTGTYIVPLGTKLAGLLDSAGGATANADPKAYDSTIILESRESYYIAPIYDNSDTCAATPIAKVCVNTAAKEKLLSCAAFTNSLAAAIVDYRSSNGLFKRLEELKNVSGIGNATFEKCKNYVTLRD
jgi:competence protein ComEA